MSEKMTVLNIRISLDEKNEIKDRAEKKVYLLARMLVICYFQKIIQKIHKITQL